MTSNGVISAASDLNWPPDQSVVSAISAPAARAVGLSAAGHRVFAPAASAARLVKHRRAGGFDLECNGQFAELFAGRRHGVGGDPRLQHEAALGVGGGNGSG